MADGAGKGLVLGGLVGVVALLVGWPLLDKYASCAGFLGIPDPSCALLRFFLFWVLMAAAVGALFTGLAVFAFGAKRGADIAASGGARGLAFAERGGRAGLGYARRGGSYAVRRATRRR